MTTEETIKIDPSKWQPGEWFPEIEDKPEPAMRGVYLKLSYDRWTLTQKPAPRWTDPGSGERRGEGLQPSGALVIVIQHVPAHVTDAEVCVLANQTTLIQHYGKSNPDLWCRYSFGELGAGKIVK